MERFSESDCSACGLPVPVDLMPDGDLVRYADAQATVEALQAQIVSLQQSVDVLNGAYESAVARAEALQRELESANALLHKKNCAIGKAEMAIEALQQEHSQLQALVRALCNSGDRLLDDVIGTSDAADSLKHHIRQVRAALDAATPAPCAHPGGELSQTGKCMRCTLPKGGDGE